MKVLLADIVEKMTGALQAKGYANSDIPFLVEAHLSGDMGGHNTHGLASFAGFLNAGYVGLNKTTVLKETHAFFMIDAQSHDGLLVGKRAADEAIKRAREEVIGCSMIVNMNDWLRPGIVAKYIADQGFVTVVSNGGGGVKVAPPGGFEPVVATNPIAYGMPREEGSLVVDLATSKRAWGNVRRANKYGTDLPADTFYDSEGNITLDPHKAHSVKSFGEYKGFALSLLFEVMCSSLIGMDLFVDADGESSYGQRLPDQGAFILVIDPRQTVGLDMFKKANSEFIQKIKDTKPLRGEKIRIPGEQATALQVARRKEGSIDIPDELWREISSL